MVEVRTFEPGDEAAMVLNDQQMATLAGVDWRASLLHAAKVGPVWTVEMGHRVIAVAGLSPQWQGRAVLWCYIATGIPKRIWPALHRAALRGLAARDERRIEAQTYVGWAPGERWLRMLGFECEGMARGFAPNGADCSSWARVK